MMTAAGGRVMATRTLNVLPNVIRVAQPREITLPKYWMELDLFDHLGEERTSYHRIAESGVFTKIVRSQFMYDDKFKWRMETSFSSDWANQLFEEADVGANLSARTLTEQEFELAEGIVLALIAPSEPEGV
jgi:hypothetical protein